jgi:hypothetical protein
MPKMHRGSVIRDTFIVEKINVVTFMDFPDPDKGHRSSPIGDFFMTCQWLSFSYFADAEGDRLSLETSCE